MRQPRPEQLLCFDTDIVKPAERILDQMHWPRPADWPQRVQDISQEHAHRPGKGKRLRMPAVTGCCAAAGTPLLLQAGYGVVPAHLLAVCPLKSGVARSRLDGYFEARDKRSISRP